MVSLNLRERDSRSAVLRVLKSCDLPTTYVDNISPRSYPKKSEPITESQYKESTAWQKYEKVFKQYDDGQIFRTMIRKAKEEETLL